MVITMPEVAQTEPERIAANNALFDNLYHQQRQAQAAADTAVRDNPYLRIALLTIIPGLRHLIGDTLSPDIVKSLGIQHHTALFAEDLAGQLLLWQLLECLMGCQIDRHETEFQQITQFTQLDLDHAADLLGIDSQLNHPLPGRTYTAPGSVKGEEVEVEYVDLN